LICATHPQTITGGNPFRVVCAKWLLRRSGGRVVAAFLAIFV